MLSESETLDTEHRNLVLNRPYSGFAVQNLATQSVVHGPALAVSPGSLLGMQTLRHAKSE